MHTSNEDLQDFGINRLLWDKVDLAIENAGRRQGCWSSELVRKAI